MMTEFACTEVSIRSTCHNEQTITTIINYHHHHYHQLSPSPLSSTITITTIINYHHHHYHQLSPSPLSSTITITTIINYHHHHYHQLSPSPLSSTIIISISPSWCRGFPSPSSCLPSCRRKVVGCPSNCCSSHSSTILCSRSLCLCKPTLQAPSVPARRLKSLVILFLNDT